MAQIHLLSWPSPKGMCLGLIGLFFMSLMSMFLYLDAVSEEQIGTPISDRTTKNDQIVRELSDITNRYNHGAVNSSIGVVMASIKNEDLSWLLDYCKESNTIPFVYTTETPPERDLLIPRTTRGREAAAYLSYVVDFYDRLPPYSIFVHSNPDQWHNDLFGPHTWVALRNLRLEAVDVNGYVNLRCEHDPGCPTSVSPFRPTDIDIKNNDIRAFFPQVYQTIFDVPLAEVPDEIGNVCCGQFAVSRERIVSRPRADYERMLEWAETTELTDSFGVGWVFEKVWHIVFGMEVLYCPRYEQCRCDAYGWCGPLPSGETLQAVMG